MHPGVPRPPVLRSFSVTTGGDMRRGAGGGQAPALHRSGHRHREGIISTPVGRLRYAFTTPWIRTVVVLTAVQVVSELAFSFALPFMPLFIQELGVTDLAEVGLWAG